jgi:long-chain acyl-CoA synthetase
MPLAVEFSTITEMFDEITTKFASEKRPAMRYKVDGKYADVSYAKLREMVVKASLGFACLGVKRGDNVALISENRPEWVVCDMGVVSLGAVTVPLYTTLTPKQTEFIFNNAGVKLAIVSNQFQLSKVMKILSQVKSLEKVVVINENGVTLGENVLSLNDVMKRGEEFGRKNADYYTNSAKKVKPDDLLTIIYTSGTTGDPKGVMLTHNNLVSNIHAAAEVLPFDHRDVFLSFLPLCHSFEKMAGYLTALASGALIAYAESVETVRDNLLEIRPTVMTAVPRFFERLFDRVRKQVDSGSPLKRRIFYWAANVGRDYAKAKRRGGVAPGLWLKHKLGDILVYKKFRHRLGGRLRFFVSGGAALAKELGEFFEAIGIQIIEGYGLTESSPVISVNRMDNYKFGTVGTPIPGIEVKIAEDGEILTRGPHIMRGYWNNPEATAESIDSEGWLHTGDVGVFDEDGLLTITDRKKHLFVSSGGKNIAPQPLENLFLQSKYIDQFVLIGDSRMFLSALVVPDFESVKSFAEKNNISFDDESELVRKPEIYNLIEKDIQSLQKDLAHYERVRKFAVIDKPFTVENGELTPTLKVKRKVVEERFRPLIDQMYQSVG